MNVHELVHRISSKSYSNHKCTFYIRYTLNVQEQRKQFLKATNLFQYIHRKECQPAMIVSGQRKKAKER